MPSSKCQEYPLVLVAGPTGSGKSTLIQALLSQDERYTYIKPYVTRQLREGEMDKVHVDDEQLDDLWRQGELLVINELYGVRYGTPRNAIEKCFSEARIALLDWPITHVSIMVRAFPGKTFVVYAKPPSADELQRRLVGRDGSEHRVEAALAELQLANSGTYTALVDLEICIDDTNIQDIAYAVSRAIADRVEARTPSENP